MAVDEDKKAISDIFLVNSLKDCVGYIRQEHWDLGRSIAEELGARNDFFALERNTHDKEIAAEAIVTAGKILEQQVTFVTDDRDFSTNFETSRIPVMSAFQMEYGLVQISHSELR
jgi:type IV secretory pathway VirD2 relaxase